jgi:hypothetical protein
LSVKNAVLVSCYKNQFPLIWCCAGQISQDIVAKRLLTHNLRSAIFTQFESPVVEAIVPGLRQTGRVEALAGFPYDGTILTRGFQQ